MKGFKKFVKKNLKTILIVLAVIVFVYLVMNRKSLVERFSGSPELMFFHVDWCGFCKKAKPEWEKLYQESSNGLLSVGGKNVKLVSINCEEGESNKKKAKEYGVQGYPTIILNKNGNKIPFEGERTKSGIQEFLQKKL